LQWYGSMRIIIKKSIVMHMPLGFNSFWTFCCAFKLISSGYTNSSILSNHATFLHKVTVKTAIFGVYSAEKYVIAFFYQVYTGSRCWPYSAFPRHNRHCSSQYCCQVAYFHAAWLKSSPVKLAALENQRPIKWTNFIIVALF
jgi:hypothetical protein